jgi:hypothetical protein
MQQVGQEHGMHASQQFLVIPMHEELIPVAIQTIDRLEYLLHASRYLLWVCLLNKLLQKTAHTACRCKPAVAFRRSCMVS